jgi:hypothetical protein
MLFAWHRASIRFQLSVRFLVGVVKNWELLNHRFGEKLCRFVLPKFPLRFGIRLVHDPNEHLIEVAMLSGTFDPSLRCKQARMQLGIFSQKFSYPSADFERIGPAEKKNEEVLDWNCSS